MKDYKKILEGVVNIINTAEKSDIGFANICTYISENCPELKESEDERIRKWLIGYFNQYIIDDMPQVFGNGLNVKDVIAWLEKQGEQRPNPYSGTSFEYNGHTWGMCARDNGVEILIDGHIKSRVFTNDSNAKEIFIKALERVEEQNSKGYKLTDCDKNSWWEDFKAYALYTTWSEEDERMLQNILECLKNGWRKLPTDVLKYESWLKSLRSRTLGSRVNENG